MSNLHDILASYVANGTVPGAVSPVARGDQVEVHAVGWADIDSAAPMARDSIFRFASITKAITAAAVMMLVEDGRIALDDPVGTWLPELASLMVVRTPTSPVEDVSVDRDVPSHARFASALSKPLREQQRRRL